LVFELIRDWICYKQRGFAKPDHPDQENYLLINNPGDASAHKIIDDAIKSNPLEEVRLP
jgi:hypothetical protein